MTITSTRLSNPLDAKKVETLLRVAPLTKQRGVPLLLVGAFARDVHLWHVHHIEIIRSTADIDLSIQLPSWDAFESLRDQLLQSGFEKPNPDHQETFRDTVTGQEIDLIPFGAISQDGEKIIWPGGGHPFSIVGFQDALEHALLLEITDGKATEALHIATLASLVLLKIVAISDSPQDRRKKDAVDVGFIIEKYLHTGHRERLKGAVGAAIMASCHDDLQRAAAYLIGEDMQRQTTAGTRSKVAALLAHEIDSQSDCPLAQQLGGVLTHGDFQAARAVLAAMRDGLCATL